MADSRHRRKASTNRMETAVYEMCRRVFWIMVLYQILPGFVAESSEQNKYQIQEPSNPEEAECKKPDDPSTRFANIEPMNTKFPKEKA